MIDALIEYWLFWLCGLIGTGIITLIKALRKNALKMTQDINSKIDKLEQSDIHKHGEIDQKLDLITRGQLETMRYRLRRNTEKILAKGCATLDELEDLEHLYDAYASLGGNSTLEAKYQLCLQLPIRSDKGRNEVD